MPRTSNQSVLYPGCAYIDIGHRLFRLEKNEISIASINVSVVIVPEAIEGNGPRAIRVKPYGFFLVLKPVSVYGFHQLWQFGSQIASICGR